MAKTHSAAVYLRPSGFIVSAYAATTAGVFITSEPTIVLPSDASPAQIGQAIRTVLADGPDLVPHPTDWKSVLTPLLQRAGVRSWNAIQRSSKYCAVSASEDAIRIIPSRNGGTRGPDKGYSDIGEKAVSVQADCSDQLLGEALLEAGSACC